MALIIFAFAPPIIFFAVITPPAMRAAEMLMSPLSQHLFSAMPLRLFISLIEGRLLFSLPRQLRLEVRR